MKTTIHLILLAFIMISCQRDHQEKDWIEIRDSRSIKQYQKFLIDFPDTKHLTEITDSLRIFWKNQYYENFIYDCYGNCLSLFINIHGQLLFDGQIVSKDSLVDLIKYSILNPDDLVHLPLKDVIENRELGSVEISLGVIDIWTDKGLDKHTYSEIIKLVKKSFIEIQNRYSNGLYGKDLKELSRHERMNIDSIQPIKINFERYIPDPPDFEKLDSLLNIDSPTFEFE